MENFEANIVDNIKHEAERHFLVILLDDPQSNSEPEAPRVTEIVINLKRIDAKCLEKAKLFDSYFVCRKCNCVITKRKSSFNGHIKICKGENKNKTTAVFKNQSKAQGKGVFSVDQTKRRKRRLYPRQCDKCYRSFVNASSFNAHRRIVHSELRYECDLCAKILRVKVQLSQHMQTHYKLPCRFCKKLFCAGFV